MDIITFILTVCTTLIAILGRKAFKKLMSAIFASESFKKLIMTLAFGILILGLTFAFLVGIMSFMIFPNIYLALSTFLLLAVGYVFSSYYTYRLANPYRTFS